MSKPHRLEILGFDYNDNFGDFYKSLDRLPSFFALSDRVIVRVYDIDGNHVLNPEIEISFGAESSDAQIYLLGKEVPESPPNKAVVTTNYNCDSALNVFWPRRAGVWTINARVRGSSPEVSVTATKVTTDIPPLVRGSDPIDFPQGLAVFPLNAVTPGIFHQLMALKDRTIGRPLSAWPVTAKLESIGSAQANWNSGGTSTNAVSEWVSTQILDNTSFMFKKMFSP